MKPLVGSVHDIISMSLFFYGGLGHGLALKLNLDKENNMRQFIYKYFLWGEGGTKNNGPPFNIKTRNCRSSFQNSAEVVQNLWLTLKSILVFLHLDLGTLHATEFTIFIVNYNHVVSYVITTQYLDMG